MQHPVAHHFMDAQNLLARLLRIYREHGGLTVAVDFDNTLFDFHYEKEKHLRAEHDYREVYDLLRRLKAVGCFIIIWTANEDEDFIKKFLSERGIPYDAINENPPFFITSRSRKIYYNILLDDAGGLRETYVLLRQFLEHISTLNQKERP